MSPASHDWAGVADAYDRSFGRLCAGSIPALLDPLGPGDDRRLLVVGTGTGTVAEAAAHRGFRVDAVDSEPTMIDFARRHRGGTGASFRVGALPDLDDHDAEFDVATANFAINHTPDPRASLREIERIVRPRGPVGVTIWPTRVSALNSIWTEVIERSGAMRPPVPRLDPSKDFDRTVDGLRNLMAGSGLHGIDAYEMTWKFRITPDELWCALPAGIAVIGMVYQAQDASIRQRMRDAFVAVSERITVGGELQLPMTCIAGVGMAA